MLNASLLPSPPLIFNYKTINDIYGLLKGGIDLEKLIVQMCFTRMKSHFDSIFQSAGSTVLGEKN